MVDEQVPTNISRPCISFYSKQLGKLNSNDAMDVGTHAVDRLASRIVSFEDEVSQQQLDEFILI